MGEVEYRKCVGKLKTGSVWEKAGDRLCTAPRRVRLNTLNVCAYCVHYSAVCMITVCSVSTVYIRR